MHGLVRRHKKLRKRAGGSTAASTFGIRILDRVALAAGILGPLTVVPQLTKILAAQNAAGVSAIAWFSAGLLDIPFLVYGLVHRDTAITTAYTLWVIGNLSVAVLALIYA